MPTLPLETRLAEVEAKLAFAEDLLEKLNLEVFRHQEKLDSLQDQLRVVYARVEAAQPNDTRQSPDERPPHY